MTLPSGATSRSAPNASGSISVVSCSGPELIVALAIRPFALICSLELAVSISRSSPDALYVAHSQAGQLGDRHGVRVGAVVQVQGVPHPVVGPPVARAPRVIALPGPGERQALLADAQRPADPAGNLIAGRRTPLIGDAICLPEQIELDLDRGAGLGAQRRRFVLVGFSAGGEFHAKALQRLLTVLFGVQALDSDQLVVILGGGQRCGGVDDQHGGSPGADDGGGVERDVLVGQAPDAHVDTDAARRR